MKIKSVLLFIMALYFSTPIVAQNRLYSRLFYLKPFLHYSKTKVSNFDLKDYTVTISLPTDNRSYFYGETVYKNKKVQALDDFFESPTMNEIQDKINKDFNLFGAGIYQGSINKKVEINTVVEVFYPDVREFIWAKSFAKVRLNMSVIMGGKEIINKKYESFYITAGTDKEFEGSIATTIEQAANVTIGMALRKALDKFYNDMKEMI